MSKKNKISGRIGRWFWAALGTLIISLASVWLIHYLGPDNSKVTPTQDPCVAYTLPDADYIQEVVEQARMDAGGSEFVEELVHESILVGHFLLWVTECGKVQEVYEREFESFLLRVTPYSIYKDNEGRECRKLDVSQKRGDRWHGSSNIYCRTGGQWTLLRKEN